MEQRIINIFISSTFNDMQSERDIIRKQVVPKLQEQLADYRVHIQVTDLRWGVDTLSVDEDKREAKVLHVCLDAIQYSKPYFIALLGERYGWLPSVESVQNIKHTLTEEQQQALGNVNQSISVTEMEILLGALGNQNLMPHSFFCFRSIDSYKDMPDSLKSSYIDAMSKDEQTRKNAFRIDKLKKRIETECEKAELEDNIVRYDAKWNEEGTSGRFEHLETFADQLYDKLYNDIISELDEEDINIVASRRYNFEIERFKSFIFSHTMDFKGREALINNQIQFLLDASNMSSVLNGVTGRFLTGFSGCGKSSLFAMVYEHLVNIASQHSLYILAHAAGVTPLSVKADQMIAGWSLQMKETLGDDILDDVEDNYSPYNRTPKMIEEFKKLLVRIQAKGLLPIVLIDSLDSFEKNNIIDVFDFLPNNVPLVCTTLPGYAEEIVKKHRNFQISNMDAFTIEDARMVILSTLKKNFKELSPQLQEQLLGITKNDGCHAYESPLWLRMALDILMELGEDDFNKIHNIQNMREDAKIDNYLSCVIGEFPPEAGQLFNYFIELSCRYFNSELTRQALTYIAIAQYGIREDYLAELIDIYWSQLDFISLRSWMRNYIQCNNKDHRWFFTHAILRQTVIHQNPELLNICQDRFFELLINHMSDDEEEQKELIHQLISRQEVDAYHRNIKKLKDIYIRTFISEFKNNPESSISFIHKYIDKYYIDSSQMISSVEHELFRESKKSKDSQYAVTATNLHNYHISHFTEEDFLENQETFEYYFIAHSALDKHLYFDVDEVEPYLDFFQKLIPKYELMKNHFGEDVLPWSLYYSYFAYWEDYIEKLREISSYEKQYHEQYSNNISDYLDDLGQWCLFNGESDDYFEKAFDVVENDRKLSVDEQIGFMQQMQHQMLKLIKSGEHNGENVDTTIENAHQLIDSYVNLFESEDDVFETSLMEFLDYSPAPTIKSNESSRPYIYPDVLSEENTIDISFNYYQPDDDEGGEWITIDSDDLDPDSFSKKVGQFLGKEGDEDDIDDEFNESDPPTDEQIKEMEAVLDEYLKSEKNYDNLYSDEANQKLREKAQLYRRLALMYIRAGYTDKSNNLLSQLGHMLVGFIINMGDNYALGSHDSEDIIKHGKLLAKLGYEEEQLRQAETISEALFHSYYHHENGESQRRIFNYLLNLYDEHNMIDKKISLLERMYEIAIRNHIERRFDSYEFYFHDLGYIRPIFRLLFKELKVSSKIKEAVIALERWVDLCHWNYTDEEDTTGYDDLDNAYDMLASLYDGTPAIIAGMKERNSVFLQDPYIMVCLDDKWGYIDHEGHIAIPIVYSRAWKAESECLSVNRDGQWGYIDLQGNEIAFLGKYNFNLDVAVPIRKGWGRVCINDNWAGFHIPDVFFPIKVECDNFYGITDGLTKVRIETEEGYRQDFLLTDGETLLFGGTKQSVKTPNQGVIVADWYNPDEDENDGHHTAIYDLLGHELTKPGRYAAIAAFGEQELSPAYTVDCNAGYVNRQGTEISSFEYERCRPFIGGMGAVCKDGKYEYGRWGFVNEQGKEVVAPQYIDVGDFHEGFAWVCLDNGTRKGFNWRGGKFGFINSKGEMIIPAIYDDVSSFYEGKALVWQKEHAFYINHEGEIIANRKPLQLSRYEDMS